MIVRCFAIMATVGAVLHGGLNARSATLSVDFQNGDGANIPGVAQLGFEIFDNSNGSSRTYSTSSGDVTVTLSGRDASLGGYFNRGGVVNDGELTYADLYNDFAFRNGPAGGGGSPQSMTLTLAGPAVTPGSGYQIKFYSYDHDSPGGSHSVVYTGASGTTGSAGPLAYIAAASPTANDQYSVSGQFFSDDEGVLTIQMTDTFSGATSKTGVRLNAFEITFSSLPGDVNHDRVVDRTDVALLTERYGQVGSIDLGDFNDDGTIGLTDLAILQASFGDSLDDVAPNSVAVPEPSTLFYFVLAALGLFRLKLPSQTKPSSIVTAM